MQERSIISALCHIRAEIIREELDGIEHVNALLLARGFNPDSQHVQRKAPSNRCKHGEMKQLILAGLREGPKTGPQLAAFIHAQRPEISQEAAYKRVYIALAHHRSKGLWRRVDEGWGLAQ